MAVSSARWTDGLSSVATAARNDCSERRVSDADTAPGPAGWPAAGATAPRATTSMSATAKLLAGMYEGRFPPRGSHVVRRPGLYPPWKRP
jgi:hypothetical protein